MIQLETEFISGAGGFSQEPLTYKQLKRTATVAIYERSRDGKVKDYEVFRIKILKAGTQVFNSVTAEDTEMYPGSSAFGHSAWSFCNLGGAMEKYDILNKTKEEIAAEEAAEENEVIVSSKRGRKAGPKAVLTLPVAEFTVGELAEQNKVQYPIAFVFVKEAIEAGSVTFIREERRHAKGKASKIYAKVEAKS